MFVRNHRWPTNLVWRRSWASMPCGWDGDGDGDGGRGGLTFKLRLLALDRSAALGTRAAGGGVGRRPLRSCWGLEVIRVGRPLSGGISPSACPFAHITAPPRAALPPFGMPTPHGRHAQPLGAPRRPAALRALPYLVIVIRWLLVRLILRVKLRSRHARRWNHAPHASEAFRAGRSCEWRMAARKLRESMCMCVSVSMGVCCFERK